MLIILSKRFFSDKSFEDLAISEQTKKAIEQMGYKKMTEIQVHFLIEDITFIFARLRQFPIC